MHRIFSVAMHLSIHFKSLFVYCIWLHLHLNDMKIPETKRFIIPEGFELDTTKPASKLSYLGE